MKVSLVDNNNANDKQRKEFKSKTKAEDKNNKSEINKQFLNKDIVDLINYNDDTTSMKKLLKKEFKSISKAKFYESKTTILRHAKFAMDAQANVSNEKVLTLIG